MKKYSFKIFFLGALVTMLSLTSCLDDLDTLPKDKDIVLGITTDPFGNDISTDITANSGGIAIAIFTLMISLYS